VPTTGPEDVFQTTIIKRINFDRHDIHGYA